MPEIMTGTHLRDLWDEELTAGMSEPERLLYRSNLLGSDKRITNFGGGNTSAKVMERDPLSGETAEVLWVKGSGGDVGSMDISGFATLYMDKLRSLKTLYRGVEFEDEMVGFLPHCTFNLNNRAASIDTPLHAYVPRVHVDHMHPDAIIAIAAAADGEAVTKTIFGDDIGWLPWKRPGFELGLQLERFCQENPDARGVVLGGHGLFTWADRADDCYRTTIEIINRAIDWLASETAGATVFGGKKVAPLDSDARHAAALDLMPAIRGQIIADGPMVGHFDDSDAILEFVCSHDLEDLAALGTSCPDHFLRTKIRPLIVGFDPANPDLKETLSELPDAIAAYRDDYAAYYEQCKRHDSPAMRNANPVVYLVPGVGMITFAKDKSTARIAAEFYTNAINVMRGASTISDYCALAPQEAFDIEYWLLEEAKLQRMPKPKEMAGKIALVTGGGGGIGSAIAERYLREGACVMLADNDPEALARISEVLAGRHGSDRVRTAVMDVTDENAVEDAFGETALEYGGLDILVSNAGIASAATIEETTLDLWNLNVSVLSTGYFLVARAAFKLFRQQGSGGSIVFIGSKNGLAASPGASAYCTAKASELHLARCLALEGAERGIRVNVVNPDAVLRGSKIWSGDWLQQRAHAYGKQVQDLEEHYRQRSLLKRSVLPDDIAEAAYFFASEASSKSTGNIINVDAGNVQAFTR